MVTDPSPYARRIVILRGKAWSREVSDMGLALLLILLALLVGGLGLFFAAVQWVLIIAAVLFVAGALVGWARRNPAV